MAKIYQFPVKEGSGEVERGPNYCWVLVELIDKVFISTTKDNMICLFETKEAAEEYLRKLRLDPRNDSLIHSITVQRATIQNA